MRIFLYLLMLLSASQVSASNGETALTYYHEALEAFDNDELAKAEQLAHKATSYIPSDGIIKTNTREVYTRVLIGRRTVREVKKYGDPNTYAPNQLLSKIKATKKEQALLAYNQHKKANPPELVIHSLVLKDEDGNNVLTALENGSLSFVIENTGKSLAEKIKINIASTSDHIPLLTEETLIGDLNSGQKILITKNYQAPKSLSTRFNKLHISAKEFDGLGNTKISVPIQSRPYFSPIIHSTLLAERSDVITTQKPATLYYEIKNTGAEVARDLTLKLDYAFANAVRLLHNIDSPNISQLKEGETRVIKFTILAMEERDDLGLSLKAHYRGSKENGSVLQLSSVNDHNKTRSTANQYLADINNFSLGKVSAVNTNTIGLIIDLENAKYKQVNNTKMMQQLFSHNLNISPENIESYHWHSKAQWSDYFNHKLISKIKNSPEVQNLHIYISGEGEFNALNNQAALRIGNDKKSLANKVVLKEWLHKLGELSLLNINVYLEAPFLSSEETMSGVVLAQNIVSIAEQNINIYSAALPKQYANAFTRTNTGIFTYALANALSGNAATNNSALVTPKALQQFIAQEIATYCQSFALEKQHPWSLLQSHQPLVKYTGQ